MNIEFLKNLGLSEEDISSIAEEEKKSAEAEYERGRAEEREKNEKLLLSRRIDEELLSSRPKNPALLKRLLDLEKVSSEGEEITGLSAQIDALREENPFLFEEDTAAPRFTLRPKKSDELSRESFSRLSYLDRVKLFSKNPTLYNKLK